MRLASDILPSLDQRHLDVLCFECYDGRAQEIQVIAGGLDPHEESPNSTEHAAG